MVRHRQMEENHLISLEGWPLVIFNAVKLAKANIFFRLRLFRCKIFSKKCFQIAGVCFIVKW
jgi:hypothetical protein